MSSIEGKTLKYAVLHASIFVPGLGQMGPTLSSDASALHKAVKMTVSHPWVLVEIEEKGGGKTVMPIPISGFTHTVLSK